MRVYSSLGAAHVFAVCGLVVASPAQAGGASFSIEPMPLAAALKLYAMQSGDQILVPTDLAGSIRSEGARGQLSRNEALKKILKGTKIEAVRSRNGIVSFRRIALNEGPSPQYREPALREPAPQEPASVAMHENAGVEEIVVTANKREENIQHVPIAITVVSGARLEANGIEDTRDLPQVVSGLTIFNNVDGTNAYLRGVGTNTVGAGSENSVATYVDNVYMMSTMGGLVQLSSIKQIEVLKGPQGTLFGRNATGGVINIRTLDPQQEPSGNLTVGYGNYNTFTGKVYLTSGITEHLAADIAGFVSLQGDGWGKNLFDGKDVGKSDQYAIRSKWLYEPGDRDQFRLIGDYSVLKGSPYSTAPLPGTAVNYGPGNTTAGERPDLAPYLGGALAPFAVVGDPYVFQGGFYDTDVVLQPRSRVRTGGGSLQWDHEFDGLKLMSVTAYRRAEFGDGHIVQNVSVPAFRSGALLTQTDTQFSQELQLGSINGARIPWVVGLYYISGEGKYPDFRITGSILTPLETLGFHATVTAKSGAAFGQVTAPLWSGADLTVGLRYTIERRGISGDTFVTLLPEFGGFTQITPAQSKHTMFRKLTWRISLDQQLAPGVLGYASYNRGFKSGLYNTVPPGGDPIEPEVLDAYEIGLKSDLLDRKLRLNLAAFYYDYKNLQVLVFTPISSLLDNGARARLYGLDLDFTARIGGHLTLTGGASVMDSEFTSYPQAAFYLLQPASAGGGAIQEIHSAKGNKLPYAPDFTFNAGANYSIPIGSGKADFNLNYSYSSKWYPNAGNSISRPSNGLLDVSANYLFPDDKWNLGIWARNITNEKYYVTVSVTGNPGGFASGIAGAPRTYGAKIGYKF